MKKILLIIVGLFIITGCNNDSTSNNPYTNNGSEMEMIIQYIDTRRGVSIIKLKTGERFIYCETPNGVDIEQIKSIDKSIELTPLDTTTLY